MKKIVRAIYIGAPFQSGTHYIGYGTTGNYNKVTKSFIADTGFWGLPGRGDLYFTN